MITLEELAGNNIPVNVSYGWTSDYKETISRIVELNAHESRVLVCILAGQNYSVVNHQITPNNAIPPTIEEIMGRIITGNAAIKDTLIFVLGNSVVPPVIKSFYDGVFEFCTEEGRQSGGLIQNENDLGRTMGVQETTLNVNQNDPRLILIGNSSESISGIQGAGFNLGCIDKPKRNKDPRTAGLNGVESKYVTSMLSLLGKGKNEWQTVANIRKGVFSSSRALKDISICEDISNIGGYEKVKEYYAYRKKYVQKETGVLKISGDMFVGPPGTGKSRLLTAIPQMIGLPGFQLDLNAALGSLQGQSERAVSETIDMLEKLAPVVVLLDEVEKLIAGVGEGEVAGNEVAAKVFGILLNAMAKENGIYWVASANKVSHLPAEFKRKGRFDNMWYIPLPGPETRARIFGIHAKLNGIDISGLDIDIIVEKMDQWTGAEIRHVCMESSVKMIADGKSKITTEVVLEEISKVKGLSANASSIPELAKWAEQNALNVD